MKNSLRNIYLVISQGCNLSCSYCYARGGDFGLGEAFMGRKTMEKALERLLPLAEGKCNISFFGGEPLLNIPLMEATVDYGRRMKEERGIELTYSLTTNGTAFGKETMPFLKGHISYIAVSLDGPQGVTDANRRYRGNDKSVYGNAVEGIRMLKEAGIPFGITATVTPDTADLLPDTVAHLASFGPRTLRIIPVIPVNGEGWKGERLRSLIEGINSANSSSIDRIFKGERPVLAEYLFKTLSHYLGSSKKVYPCTAGEGILGVSAKGDVYPCDHFVGTGGFKMGNVFEAGFPGGSFLEIQERLWRNSVDGREKCRECGIKYLCGGECHARSFMITGDIETPSPDYCALMKSAAENIRAKASEGLGTEGKRIRLLEFIGKPSKK